MRGILSKIGLATVAGSLVFAGGTALAQDIVLGYVPASLEYPYNVATAKGFEEQAKALGAKAVIIDPRGSVDKQANAIDDLLAQNVQGIAALPLDGLVAKSWVEKVSEKGLPFVSVATVIGDPQKVAWENVDPMLTALVGMDNVAAGARAGELAAKLLPTDHVAKIAIVEGAPGYPQVAQRSQGFTEALDKAGAKYEVVVSQPTEWTPDTGEAVCQNALIAHPDIDLIYSQADDMALGCARALEAANSKAKLIATGGGSKLGIQAIESGELLGSVCDRPEEAGRLAAKALYEAVTQKNSKKAQLITFDTPAITKDNLSDCPDHW